MGHSARGFHSLRRLWGAYERALGVAPVLTQAASSACIWGLGAVAAQRVQKFAILPLDFSTATGELTPTLKLKRAFVCEKHAALIKEIYTQNKSAVWLQQV